MEKKLKKYVTLKTTSGVSIRLNRDSVVYLEASSGYESTYQWDTPNILGNTVYSTTDGTDITVVAKTKTAIWTTSDKPIYIDSPVTQVAKLLDPDGDYSMEEALYD